MNRTGAKPGVRTSTVSAPPTTRCCTAGVALIEQHAVELVHRTLRQLP